MHSVASRVSEPTTRKRPQEKGGRTKYQQTKYQMICWFFVQTCYWLNFLVFCLHHPNMIWDFVRIISNKKMFILHFVLFWALSCSFFWVLGVGRPVSLKNPNNPFLGWLKTLSNDDNDLRYSPPAWRRGSAKSSKTRGHVAHSGVSEQGPLCLFTFLTFCLSAFLT